MGELPIVRSPNVERLARVDTPSSGRDRRWRGQSLAGTNDLARVFCPMHETTGPLVETFSDFKDAASPLAIPLDGQASVTTRWFAGARAIRSAGHPGLQTHRLSVHRPVTAMRAARDHASVFALAARGTNQAYSIRNRLKPDSRQRKW